MINILISTINDRIEKVKEVLLSPREDVHYIISHQYTSETFKKIPSELKRSDVTVSQIKGVGISRSRNNAIRLANGDIGLFSDDDVTYRHNYIDNLKKAFLNNPDMDVGIFKIKTSMGEPEYKNYPESQIRYNKKLFSVSSIEIAFNINSIQDSGIYFDERFGVGEKLLIGSEEIIFIDDCMKFGLNVTYVPEYIVEHPHLSTINSIPKFDKRRIWITGAYDCRRNGKIALIKSFLGTIKILPELLRHKINPFFYFYHRFSAVVYILRSNKKRLIN